MSNQRIKGFTIAVFNMDAMIQFYTQVFGISFRKENMFDATLYKCIWDGLEVLFCPAELAQNTSNQNRHQFDIIVEDLEIAILKVLSNEGKLISKIKEGSIYKSIGVKDPDNNSLVLKQILIN
jgi:predicted enzyme related to lactoylglutathione lyase